MAEIKQTLGFDASKAIETLARLDSNLRSFKASVSSTAKALGSFNAKADKTSGVLKRLNASAGSAATQVANLNKASGATQLNSLNAAASQASSTLDKLGNTAQSAGTQAGEAAEDAAKKTQKWTISWQTLARVVATQMIVRTLSAIRQALGSAVSGAVDFQRALAEIGTIAPQLGLENTADMVRGIADEFNVGLDDTAEAAYETISNQIADTRNELESFLGTAARFSKITKTDMATSVDLLSGVLNAFGKSVSETDDLAAKFFKTIDLGRVRADELSHGYGTVAPIADKLGISFEELNASISTLTISGIQADKAFTQIRGVMQSFLKPTTEMKEAMRELGFESGEQVFEAYNLQEALEAVIGTTDGNAAAVAKLVPRIRGLTGAIGLADDKAGHFDKTMEAQKKALDETYRQAYHLVITTDAEKVTKGLNQIKNLFIDVFGQKFLSGVAKAFGVFEQFATSEVEYISKAYDERRIIQETTIKNELQVERTLLEEKAKLLAQYAATARKEFMVAARAAEEANEIISSSTQWAIDSMMGPVDAAIAAITKASNEINNTLAEGTQLAASSTEKVQDILFQWSVKAADDPLIKITMLRKKAAEASIKAQELASQADFKGAKAAQNNYVALIQQAHGIAISAKETKVAADLARFLAIRTDRLAKATEVGRQTTKDGAKGLAEAGRGVIAYKANLEVLIKKMQEAQKAASDKDLTPVDQVKLAKEAQDAVDKYLDFYSKGIEKFAQSADPLVRKLFQDIEARDMAVEIDTIMTLPSNMKEIFGQIRSASETFFKSLPVEVQLFAKGRGLETDTTKQADEVLSQYNQSLEEQAIALNAAKVAQAALNNETKKIEAIIESLTDQVTTGEAFGEFFQSLWAKGPLGAAGETLDKGAQFADFETTLEGIKKGLSTGFTTQELQVVTKQLENLAIRGFMSVDALRQLNDSLVKLPALKEASKAELNLSGQEQLISDLSKVGEPSKELLELILKEEQALQQTDVAAQQLNTTQQTVGTTVGGVTAAQASVTAEINNSNSAAQQLVSTLSRAQSMSGSMMVSNPMADFNSKGGKVGYFAAGGRGTDTIPAMLSAGEFVTNARSSQRFFSQLQAMNAGQKPVFKNDGGDTFNTNVGDINVSGSGSPQQTAREVMKAIRREERRGSGR